MSLESLGTYFESDRAKRSLFKAQLAFELAKVIKTLVDDEVKIILRRRSIVIECPNELCAATLTLQRRQVAQAIAHLVSLEEYKLRIVSS